MFTVLFAASACEFKPDRGGAPSTAAKGPRFADARFEKSFKIELFAALDPISPPLKDVFNPKGPGQQYAFYDLVLAKEATDILPGLYATSGPYPGPRGDRIFRIDAAGDITVFRKGFNSTSQLALTQGTQSTPIISAAYKEVAGAMLVAEPLTGGIRSVDPLSMKLGTMAKVPIFPRGMTFGLDIFPNDPRNKKVVLYVEGEVLDVPGKGPGKGAGKGRVLRVLTNGDLPTLVAEFEIPKPPPAKGGRAAGAACGKSVLFDYRGTFAGGVPGLIVSTFTISSVELTPDPPLNLDVIYSITPSPDGPRIRKLATGLNGIMYIKLGPGGEVYGSDLYIPMLGTPNEAQNGAVMRLSPDGTLRPFLKNIKATAVAFDMAGVLGVKEAMYVSEFTPYKPGRIWRIVPTR